jgi:hypothetical protein
VNQLSSQNKSTTPMNMFQKYRSTQILLGSIATSVVFFPIAAQAVTFNFTGRIDNFTVPTTGIYRITAFGAQGGSIGTDTLSTGGLGSKTAANFKLVANDSVNIFVGGSGSSGSGSGGSGGGGGSFALTQNPFTPLLAAGGGGGAGSGSGFGGGGGTGQGSVGRDGTGSGGGKGGSSLEGNGGGSSSDPNRGGNGGFGGGGGGGATFGGGGGGGGFTGGNGGGNRIGSNDGNGGTGTANAGLVGGSGGNGGNRIGSVGEGFSNGGSGGTGFIESARLVDPAKLLVENAVNAGNGRVEIDLVRAFVTTLISTKTNNGDTTGGPIWNRPLPNLSALSSPSSSDRGTAARYSVLNFRVDNTNIYDFLTTSTFDNFSVLYQGNFDPANPLANAIIASDDLGGSSNSGFALELAANNYFLVTTGFNNADFGAFTTTIKEINVADPAAVPEPFTIVGTIIGGTAAMRMRKKLLKSTVEQ